MQVNFTLTVTITGASLEEVDNGLVQAAGERLRARMLNPPKGPLGVVNVVNPNPTVQRDPVPAVHVAVAEAPKPFVNDEKKRRGRPVGTTKAANEAAKHQYLNQGEQKNVQVEQTETKNDERPSPSHAPSAAAPSQGTPEIAQASHQITPQAEKTSSITGGAGKPVLDDAVKALMRVNSKINTDAARGVLNHFNIKRCGDLTDDNRGAFIAHCNSLCGM